MCCPLADGEGREDGEDYLLRHHQTAIEDVRIDGGLGAGWKEVSEEARMMGENDNQDDDILRLAVYPWRGRWGDQ